MLYDEFRENVSLILRLCGYESLSSKRKILSELEQLIEENEENGQNNENNDILRNSPLYQFCLEREYSISHTLFYDEDSLHCLYCLYLINRQLFMQIMLKTELYNDKFINPYLGNDFNFLSYLEYHPNVKEIIELEVYFGSNKEDRDDASTFSVFEKLSLQELVQFTRIIIRPPFPLTVHNDRLKKDILAQFDNIANANLYKCLNSNKALLKSVLEKSEKYKGDVKISFETSDNSEEFYLHSFILDQYNFFSGRFDKSNYTFYVDSLEFCPIFIKYLYIGRFEIDELTILEIRELSSFAEKLEIGNISNLCELALKYHHA